MPDHRCERKIKAALAAADKLAAEGHAFEAEAVRALVRAHRGVVQTASRLYDDNMALRQADA
ncbi:MAG: hypothetical protein AAGI03_00555 [Pseudomonadota bacterium]